jgi:hypothetical protein
MARPYPADTSEMRYLAAFLIILCFAAPAAAATPRFGLFDLHDLTKTSRNEYGDVKVSPRPPAAAFAVRCSSGCRFGTGWLGFVRSVGPAAGDVVSASARSGRIGWSLELGLSPRGQSRWRAFAKLAKVRARQAGVPDVLAIAVGARVLSAPLVDQIRFAGGRLELPGFTRAEARAAAKSFAG